MDAALLLLPVLLSASVLSALVLLLLLKNTKPGGSPGPGGAGAGPMPFLSAGGTGWKKATSTYYWSYPKCCPDSPTYDKNADKSECDDYSGCRWMGQFSALSGKQPFDWVKNTNIAAFFEVGQTEDSWKRKWKNRKLRIRNPKTNMAMDVVVYDRCGDSDCGGCCTKNAQKNGGTLIDLEWHTARRFWGTDAIEGIASIEWKCLDC